MTSLFSPNHQSSSSISEGSSAPPSPASSVHCARSTASLSVSNAASPGIVHNVPRYGTWIPNRVFVGGISNSTTENDLHERFDAYGSIKEIKIIRDKSGACKGYGFITFDSDEAAKRAQNEPEIIVLKERRLNIAPAVVKQSFSRPYDLTQPGTLMYHQNGATYAFDNGMAFFTPGPTQSPFSARETTIFSSPYAASQGSATGHTFSPVMYPYTPQPVAYVPTGQQFSYQPISYDPYFKSSAATASQYLYGHPSTMNGSLNGPNQSTSPGYGQPPGPGLHGPGLPGPGPGHSGPPLPPTPQYYHPASDLYYNGGAPHQTAIYPMEGPQTDEYDPRERDTATPVVSLLKLQERGIEEMEITRTPKKSMVGSGVSSLSAPPYRSIYTPVHIQNQRPPRVRRIINSTGQPTGPPSVGRNGRGNPCQHRPPGSMSGYQGGPGGHSGPGRPQHPQRRIISMSRSTTRNSFGSGNMNSRPSPVATVSPAQSPTLTAATPSPSASPSPSLPDKTGLPDEEGVGDAEVARHHLPPSPPHSPLPIVKPTGTDDKEMCQQMQALAM